MSHSYYDNIWLKSLEDLTALLNLENPIDTSSTIEIITSENAYSHYCILYIKYSKLLYNLNDCYDQIIHPQKRRDIKFIVDIIMCRIIQIKYEIIKFNSIETDFINLDKFLIDLNISPNELEFPIPLHFKEDINGTRLPIYDAIDQAYEQHNIEYQDDDTLEFKAITEMSVHQAVKIIQTHERGRQGVNRAKIMKDLKEDDYTRPKSDVINRRTDPVQAAITIQKVFRGFLARRMVKAEALDELVFLGIVPSKKEEVNPEVREAAIRQLRKTRQVDNELQYIQALEELKVSLKETEGPEIKEKFRDERFQWWLKEKEEKGIMHDDFTEFYNKPDEEKEEDNDADADEKEGKKGKKEKGEKKEKGDKKEAKKDGKKEDKKDKKKESAEDENPESESLLSSVLIGPTAIINDMKLCIEKYKKVWSGLDESDNFQQRYNVSMAKETVMPYVKENIRQEIDVSLIELLANLKQQALQQLDEEAKGKGKKVKAAKATKKEKKSKKADKKTEKKKSKEKCCDGLKLMREEDTFNTMLSELIENRILQKLPRKFKDFKSFIGDFNLIGSSYQDANLRLDPSMAQLRTNLCESAILPLGSAYVKSNTPVVNSILLFGPSGSGKSHLSKAIACHAGATWFDLSPNILEGIDLTDKTVASRFVHVVFTLAEQMQPSVIYIDEIEKVFAGKNKKIGSSADVSKIKKDLMSHKDLLTSEHRILIVGNSREPFDESVDIDELCSFFSVKSHGKAFFCPHPDYQTRLKLWNAFITKKGLDIPSLSLTKGFDLNSLAYVSSGYTAGSIAQAVNSSLTARRIQQISEGKRSIESSEFLSALSKTKCFYDDEYKNFSSFNDLITGEKSRRDAEKGGDAESGGGKKKDKKDKKKKKK